MRGMLHAAPSTRDPSCLHRFKLIVRLMNLDDPNVNLGGQTLKIVKVCSPTCCTAGRPERGGLEGHGGCGASVRAA